MPRFHPLIRVQHENFFVLMHMLFTFVHILTLPVIGSCCDSRLIILCGFHLVLVSSSDKEFLALIQCGYVAIDYKS